MCLDFVSGIFKDLWSHSAKYIFLKQWIENHITTHPCFSVWVDQPWTDCSVSCGGGNMTKSRQCQLGSDGVNLGADACGGGPLTFMTDCNTHKCAAWTEWGQWFCPAYCGQSTYTRNRTCEDTTGGGTQVSSSDRKGRKKSTRCLTCGCPLLQDDSHCELVSGENAVDKGGSCTGRCPCKYNGLL